jgi:hypothetical protein
VIIDDRVIAVVEQHTSQLGVRAPSSLEQAYLETASLLAQMITVGAFPLPDDGSNLAFSPRVGDGFIRIDKTGTVEYASPNALSAYRRLGLIGDLVGEHLPTLTAALFPAGPDPVDDSIGSVLSGRKARRAEMVSGEAHMMVRVLPLLADRDRVGAIVLCRDVSDLRSKERQLVTKDATIREIHHRVKNNLQTVAALLRMQSRRMTSPEAKVALNDATSRVASIAIVHETLSQAFDEIVEFDRVADGLLRMVGEVAASTPSSTGWPIAPARSGWYRQPSTGGSGSRSATMGGGCRRTSTGVPRAASDCPSSAPWWQNWRALSSSVRSLMGPGLAPWWTSRSGPAERPRDG